MIPTSLLLRRFLRYAGVALVLAHALASAPAHAIDNVVRTESGAVRGVYRHGVFEFRGIPYAAAPKGELRWALPQPPAPWQLLDASQFGPACPQQARFGLTEESLEEDCLSLNVSVPGYVRPDEKLPVLFYIHGGGFVGGASRLYRLDKLVREGRMIVVSANYRVGAFGFMPHPALARDGHNGNLGLEDQRAALRWVQRNIAAFGGDAGNVTVAGESAGAGSICMHLASPERVEGLFHKAVVLSAGCMAELKTVSQAEAVGRRLAHAVGCSDDAQAASCMRSKDVSVWLTEQGKYADGNPTDLLPFAPVIGDASVPRSFRDAVASGKVVRVPLMMGGARDEIRLYVGYWVQGGKAVTAENFAPTWLTHFYADKAALVAQRHAPGASPAATLGSLLSSYNPRIAINNCLYLRSAEAYAPYGPVWQFEFADRNAPVMGVGMLPPDPGFELGAVHSAALNYLFPRYDNTSRISAPELPPESQELADRMVAYWASFAHTGVPRPAALPAWPEFAASKSVMLFNPGELAPYDAAAHHDCAFWRGLYPGAL